MAEKSEFHLLKNPFNGQKKVILLFYGEQTETIKISLSFICL